MILDDEDWLRRSVARHADDYGGIEAARGSKKDGSA
jgi:hypothetical protein